MCSTTWFPGESWETVLTDGFFSTATSVFISQNLSYLSSWGCIWPEDLCCQAVKTRALLRKRNVRNHTCDTDFCYFLHVFKVYTFFNGRIVFLSVRNLLAIRSLVFRYLSLNKLIMSPFRVNGGEYAVDCSSEPPWNQIQPRNGHTFLLSK